MTATETTPALPPLRSLTGVGRRRKTLRQILRILAWAAVAAVVVAAGAWFLFWQPQPVDAVRPRRGPIVSEVFGTGTLESKVVVGVSAKITGKVVDVSVDQGDQVASGQILG